MLPLSHLSLNSSNSRQEVTHQAKTSWQKWLRKEQMDGMRVQGAHYMAPSVSFFIRRISLFTCYFSGLFIVYFFLPNITDPKAILVQCRSNRKSPLSTRNGCYFQFVINQIAATHKFKELGFIQTRVKQNNPKSIDIYGKQKTEVFHLHGKKNVNPRLDPDCSQIKKLISCHI